MPVKNNPFEGAMPEKIVLSEAPISGVLVQVAFPAIMSIAKQDFIASFQELLRSEYPISTKDDNLSIELSAEGFNSTSTPNWRFMDPGQGWRVSLTTNFFTLETRNYAGQSDFLARLGGISDFLTTSINPRLMSRIGIRYVNRIYGENYDQLRNLVQPEVLGVATKDNRTHIIRTLNETVAKTTEGKAIVKWGLMPENQTHEPDIMPAIGNASWFLDIDSNKTFDNPVEFGANEIVTIADQLANRAYSIFRWAVKDEFLEAYGGKV